MDNLQGLGRISIFTAQTFRWIFTSFTPWRLLAPQLYEVGVRSVPVVCITGAFVGMVLAVQTYFQLDALGFGSRTGSIINISVLKELGPVLAAVMLAGRVGGALAAELGTMKVTEQIDALRSLAADPIKHLVVPRFLACFLLIPFLTIYCDFMGILGGYTVVVIGYGADAHEYWLNSAQFIENFDVFAGIIKSTFFGAAIAIISCYKGFHSRQGAHGVGKATTDAFVASFMAILVLDLFIAIFLQALYTALWGQAAGII
ncbi:MAG: ABC transporter permease [Phycisphaerae bacterium]|nr:ABC transporter permease [Phycisphaerae bacterium]